MKYILIAISISFFTFSTIAQNSTEFGIKGGLNFTFFKVDQFQFGENVDVEVGYYGGLFVDFKIEDRFHFQPEVLYIGIGDFRFINAPLYLKYDINTSFQILVGPSLNYFFDFFSNKFKVRADLGLAYELSPSIQLDMKYVLGFDEVSPNGLFLGVGYKF